MPHSDSAVIAQPTSRPDFRGDQRADPDGWDTVFGIRFSDVNASIEKAKTSPETFSASASESGTMHAIAGDFGDWRLDVIDDPSILNDHPGFNESRIVIMVMPTTDLVYTRSVEGQPDEQQTFSNVRVQAAVEFSFIPQPQGAGSDGGQWLDLKLAPPPGSDAPSRRNGPVQVLNILYDGDDMSATTRFIIQGLFGEWLNDPANLQEFNHVFASVNLNAKAAVDHFQWMMPTHIAYGVNMPDRIDDGVLGVFCMTEGRSADGLSPNVPRGLIPSGERSGFVISKERFLSQLLLPGVGLTFSGPIEEQAGKTWPQDYFQLNDDETSISNTADLVIEKLDLAQEGKKPNYKRATLKARNFNVRFEDRFLQFEIVDLFHHYNHLLSFLDVYHTIRVNTAPHLTPGGLFDLLPGPEGEDCATHTVVAKQTKAAEWVELAILSLTLFATTIGLAKAGWAERNVFLAAEGAEAGGQAALNAGGQVNQAGAAQMAVEGGICCNNMLTRGVMRFKSFLSATIETFRGSVLAKVAFFTSVSYTIDRIIDIIARNKAEEKLPKFKEFAAGMFAPVKWPDAAEFEVKDVRFNGSFQIIGDPQFAHDRD